MEGDEIASEKAPASSAEFEPEDDDEVVIEETPEAAAEELKAPETKTVTVDEWVQMNAQAPIWTR